MRSLKYLVLSFFAYAVIGMSAASIADFLNSPYTLIVDVRMLNFFRYIGGTAAWVALGLVIASIFVQNFSCCYLCPYGGFLGLVSLLSPVRITRNASTCIDCAKCAKACPSRIAGRQTATDPVGRVHRMFGVCSSMSSQRNADHERTVGRAKAPCNSSMEHGRGNRDFVSWSGRLRKGHRPVEHESAEAGLS